ncbi:unnamed protein product [Orchesella dallaii]|uniref:F-box domain-containing protein n=1 Tax=Orchesella dallaii TaxID=48710 RepID=A0ABP1PVW1_9HEXA
MSRRPEYSLSALSPLAFNVVDETGAATAEFVYHVDTGILQPLNQLSPNLQNVSVSNSTRSIGNVVYINQYAVRNRSKLAASGIHWLCRSIGDDGESLGVKNSIPAFNMESALQEFLNSWNNPNPLYVQVKARRYLGLNCTQSSQMTQKTRLEELPTVVFDLLTLYLDGISVLSLSQTSHAIEDLLNESFRIKTGSVFHRYCKHDINNETVIKIMRSFDPKLRNLQDEIQCEAPSWKSIFLAYKDYTNTIMDGIMQATIMESMSADIQHSLISNCQEGYQCDILQESGSSCYWNMSSIGGGLFFLSMCPIKLNRMLRASKTVVYRFQDDGHAIYTSSTYCGSKYHHFGTKVINFPHRQLNNFTKKVPGVDRLLITVNEYYINVIPVLGGGSSRLKDLHVDVNLGGSAPIFEIHKNILALWVSPHTIKFYVISIDESGEYKINVLQEFGFANLENVWRKLMINRKGYVTVIKEFCGFVDVNQEAYFAARNFDDTQTCTTDVHYGLCFISHLYGVESFKPSTKKYHAVLESYSPRYFANSCTDILAMAGKTKCSAKGHGIFVFCTNQGAAVSFDSIMWFFTTLPLPPQSEVSTVEVVGDDILLIGVNDKLLFLRLSIISKMSSSDPFVDITTLRIIALPKFPLYGKISKTEFDFDCGKPIVIVTSIQESICTETNQVEQRKKGFGLTLVTKVRIVVKQKADMDRDDQMAAFGVDALPTLPPELWDEVFSYLQGSDYFSAMHASEKFYSMMQKKRTTALFPLISKHLASWMSFSDLLKMRSVCRSWRRGVDLVYEQFPYGIRNGDPVAGVWLRETTEAIPNPGVTLTLSNEVDRFISDMADSLSNPFIGHQLKIQCHDEESVLFYDRVRQLLDRFGHHVWRIVFTIESISDFYQCLVRMPQLRAIETDYSLDTDDNYYSVMDYLSENQLPHLPQLEILISECFQRDPFAEALAHRHASNLKQLTLETPFVALNNTAALLTHVELLGGCCSMEGLQTIASNGPPLEKLHIDVVADNGQYLDALQVFQNLSAFRLTLQSLFLCGNFSNDYNQELLSFKLDMPKLKILKLMFYKGPLDPILSCANLNLLWLMNYNLMDMPNTESRVDFKITDKLTLLTNLWELLPRLATIVVPRPLCSASRYLQFHRMT